MISISIAFSGLILRSFFTWTAFQLERLREQNLWEEISLPSQCLCMQTIWDGSDWATNGGKYRVNYKYAPYVAEIFRPCSARVCCRSCGAVSKMR
ncbi:hypothetical protein NC652_024361 [Populus alba x Populus x berolinensis]|nr:hypothetical protein NC652_024361 [Populus alba x Populus x berolinensis]